MKTYCQNCGKLKSHSSGDRCICSNKAYRNMENGYPPHYAQPIQSQSMDNNTKWGLFVIPACCCILVVILIVGVLAYCGSNNGYFNSFYNNGWSMGGGGCGCSGCCG